MIASSRPARGEAEITTSLWDDACTVVWDWDWDWDGMGEDGGYTTACPQRMPRGYAHAVHVVTQYLLTINSLLLATLRPRSRCTRRRVLP